MLKQIILWIIVVGYAWGCTSTHNNNFFSLEKSVKTNAKSLPIDTIGFFEELIYARDFWTYQDSILIIRNRKQTDGYFLELYNLKREKIVSKLFRLGNGPEEMLSAKIEINGNMLTANDYVKNQVAFLNIDSILQHPEYKATIVRHYTQSPTVVQYKENQLLIENPYYFRDDKLGIDNKAPRFIIADKKIPHVENKKYKYYTRNVSVDGCVITNYQRNRIIYAESHIPKIEIYDTDLNLIKLIEGPDVLPPDYRIVNDFDQNEVLFKKGYIPYTYLSYCTDKNFFYLTYMGDYLDVGQNKNMEDYPMWVFKFDWEGCFIDSYYIGRYVSSISISSDGDHLYATAISEEKNPFLIKLPIK